MYWTGNIKTTLSNSVCLGAKKTYNTNKGYLLQIRSLAIPLLFVAAAQLSFA
jgi:hypothetical protein